MIRNNQQYLHSYCLVVVWHTGIYFGGGMPYWQFLLSQWR